MTPGEIRRALRHVFKQHGLSFRVRRRGFALSHANLEALRRSVAQESASGGAPLAEQLEHVSALRFVGDPKPGNEGE